MDFLIEFSDSFELDSEEYFNNPKYDAATKKNSKSKNNRILSS